MIETDLFQPFPKATSESLPREVPLNLPRTSGLCHLSRTLPSSVNKNSPPRPEGLDSHLPSTHYLASSLLLNHKLFGIRNGITLIPHSVLFHWAGAVPGSVFLLLECRQCHWRWGDGWCEQVPRSHAMRSWDQMACNNQHTGFMFPQRTLSPLQDYSSQFKATLALMACKMRCEE